MKKRFTDERIIRILREAESRDEPMKDLTCLIPSCHFNLGERPRLLQLNNTAA